MIKKELKVVTCLALILSIPNLSYAEQANPESSVTTEISAEKSSDALKTTTKEVVVTGYGLNHEQALKNALQSAVEQEVGVLIDSETVINNNEIIKNEILTASNGFVEKFDEISTSQNNGLIELKIKAKVKSQAVSEKIKSLNISSITIKDPSGLYAETVTKVQSKEDRQKILDKALEKILSSKSLSELLSVQLQNFNIDHKNSGDGKVPVIINYNISFNKESYSSKINDLEKTSSGIGAELNPTFDYPKIKNFNGKFLSLQGDQNIKAKENNLYIIIEKSKGIYITREWGIPSDLALNIEKESNILGDEIEHLEKQIKITILDKEKQIINGENENHDFMLLLGDLNGKDYVMHDSIYHMKPITFLPLYSYQGNGSSPKTEEKKTTSVLIPIESIGLIDKINIEL